jgi:hypothetical protein
MDCCWCSCLWIVVDIRVYGLLLIFVFMDCCWCSCLWIVVDVRVYGLLLMFVFMDCCWCLCLWIVVDVRVYGLLLMFVLMDCCWCSCRLSVTLTDATNGTETAYFSGTHDFTTFFCGVRVDQSLVFLFVFCDHWLSFLAHLAKGHVSFCHHLASVVRGKLSHFNLLLRNHWANCNQTLVEWSLDGPLPKCVRWSRLPTKMAAKLKIEKREGWNFNCPLLH